MDIYGERVAVAVSRAWFHAFERVAMLAMTAARASGSWSSAIVMAAFMYPLDDSVLLLSMPLTSNYTVKKSRCTRPRA